MKNSLLLVGLFVVSCAQASDTNTVSNSKAKSAEYVDLSAENVSSRTLARAVASLTKNSPKYPHIVAGWRLRTAYARTPNKVGEDTAVYGKGMVKALIGSTYPCDSTGGSNPPSTCVGVAVEKKL